MISMLRKQRVALIIIAFLGFCFLFSLGVWQVKRSSWKKNIINTIEYSQVHAPLIYRNVRSKIQGLPLHIVSTPARWQSHPYLYIQSQYREGKLGYHALGIIELPDGKKVVVNRGWVDHKNLVYLQDGGRNNFIGRVRLYEKKKWFMPEHATARYELAFIDKEAIENILGIKVAPFYFEEYRPLTNTKPYPIERKEKLSDNHLTYALTWFLLSFGWLSVFLVRARVAKPKQK